MWCLGAKPVQRRSLITTMSASVREKTERQISSPSASWSGALFVSLPQTPLRYSFQTCYDYKIKIDWCCSVILTPKVLSRLDFWGQLTRNSQTGFSGFPQILAVPKSLWALTSLSVIPSVLLLPRQPRVNFNSAKTFFPSRCPFSFSSHLMACCRDSTRSIELQLSSK